MITNWRKSRYSGNSGGNCVEVGGKPGIVGIRDSKNPRGGFLTVSPTAWAGFVTALARPA
ncbi:MAG TPA: DUF397 domain-containing protein [Pseudonocardiaceae bacterium]|nr:DUF397 domain-containing protein [Pseudonocardiaceae bacterium]